MKNIRNVLITIIIVCLSMCCCLLYNYRKSIIIKNREIFFNSINLMCIDIENLKKSNDIPLLMRDLSCNLGKAEISYLMTPYYNDNKDFESTLYLLDCKLTEDKSSESPKFINELNSLVPALKRITNIPRDSNHIDKRITKEIYEDIAKVQ